MINTLYVNVSSTSKEDVLEILNFFNQKVSKLIFLDVNETILWFYNGEWDTIKPDIFQEDVLDQNLPIPYFEVDFEFLTAALEFDQRSKAKTINQTKEKKRIGLCNIGQNQYLPHLSGIKIPNVVKDSMVMIMEPSLTKVGYFILSLELYVGVEELKKLNINQRSNIAIRPNI